MNPLQRQNRKLLGICDVLGGPKVSVICPSCEIPLWQLSRVPGLSDWSSDNSPGGSRYFSRCVRVMTMGNRPHAHSTRRSLPRPATARAAYDFFLDYRPTDGELYVDPLDALGLPVEVWQLGPFLRRTHLTPGPARGWEPASSIFPAPGPPPIERPKYWCRWCFPHIAFM